MNSDLKKQDDSGTEQQSGKLFFIMAIIMLVMMIIRLLIFVSLDNITEKWAIHDEISAEERTDFANLVMIPEIAPYIADVAERGIRDPEYRIITETFPSLEMLFAILPSAQSEFDSVYQVSVPDKMPDENIITVYQTEHLPVSETESDGSENISRYYGHENYIVQTDKGFQFVFFVQTT